LKPEALTAVPTAPDAGVSVKVRGRLVTVKGADFVSLGTFVVTVTV
jgi:hypothetical protein